MTQVTWLLYGSDAVNRIRVVPIGNRSTFSGAWTTVTGWWELSEKIGGYHVTLSSSERRMNGGGDWHRSIRGGWRSERQHEMQYHHCHRHLRFRPFTSGVGRFLHMRPLHPTRSKPNSRCKPNIIKSFLTHVLQVFLSLPLSLTPSSLKYIYAETQSSQSFRSTWPNHRSLLRLTTCNAFNGKPTVDYATRT